MYPIGVKIDGIISLLLRSLESAAREDRGWYGDIVMSRTVLKAAHKSWTMRIKSFKVGHIYNGGGGGIIVAWYKHREGGRRIELKQWQEGCQPCGWYSVIKRSGVGNPAPRWAGYCCAGREITTAEMCLSPSDPVVTSSHPTRPGDRLRPCQTQNGSRQEFILFLLPLSLMSK